MMNTRSSRPDQQARERHNSSLKDFPIEKLPKELRDAIWEEAFYIGQIKTPDQQPLRTSRISRQLPTNKSSADSKCLGRGYDAIFVEYRPSPIAGICLESRDVVKRVCERDEKPWLQRRETLVAVVISIVDAEGTEPLLPILPLDNYLIIEFPENKVSRDNSLMRNWRVFDIPHLSSRFLDLILVAKDYQIKFRHPYTIRYGLPAPTVSNPLPLTGESKKWLQSDKPQFISFYDRTAWDQLKNIISHYGDVRHLINHALDVNLRSKIVTEVLEPLKKLWEVENKEHLRAGKQGLKPLPKIDVVAVIYLYEKREFYGCLELTPEPRDIDFVSWRV
ncbi:hypothetical protein QBC38DRAFT_516602 [Podospora fimiseda]|uniref:Uncharacterized protein n=1 Tax=Podospora fimiseda TaxID=252190 RepID=A0AAN7GXU0_9PEZI|nr:hypothetical protein QBC38DRAFT_516602 [Podospora fimiseda]